MKKPSLSRAVVALTLWVTLAAGPAAAASSAAHGGTATWCGTWDWGIEVALAKHAWNQRPDDFLNRSVGPLGPTFATCQDSSLNLSNPVPTGQWGNHQKGFGTVPHSLATYLPLAFYRLYRQEFL